MNKKTTAIITVIFTVISLVWILLTYFGIVRYFTIYYKSTESYIKKYQKLDKADNNKVVINISINNGNPQNLIKVVKSLLDQTVRVDEISITLPYKSKYVIPMELKDVIKKYNISKEYKKSDNIIPILLREGEKHTKIIMLEDDTIYGVDFVEEVVNKSNGNPDTAITNKNKLILFNPNCFSGDGDITTQTNCISKINKKIEIDYTGNYKII